MIRGIGLALLLALAAGCTTVTPAPPSASDEQSLTAALAALDASVDPAEAAALSRTAYRASRELTTHYRMVGSADIHNLLVNLGLRERGLCCDWARDMLLRLAALDAQTLTLHWITAYEGQGIDEHNSVLVTPRGGGLANGIVIDGWRSPGRLVWIAAPADRYPWQLHAANPDWQRIHCAIERPAEAPARITEAQRQ